MLVCLPTGAGKTVIFSHLARLAQRQVLVLAHREELLFQAREKLQRALAGEQVVAIERGADRGAREAKVLVCSIRSLHEQRLAAVLRERDVGLVVYDECHHAAAADKRHDGRRCLCPVDGRRCQPIRRATSPLILHSSDIVIVAAAGTAISRRLFMRHFVPLLVFSAFVAAAPAAHAAPFWTTPTIHGYGRIHYLPDSAYRPQADQTYRIVFSVTQDAKAPATVNAALDHVARTVNLYAAAGVPLSHLKFVAIISGGATPHQFIAGAWGEVGFSFFFSYMLYGPNQNSTL
jgi:hypothetical protein